MNNGNAVYYNWLHIFVSRLHCGLSTLFKLLCSWIGFFARFTSHAWYRSATVFLPTSYWYLDGNVIHVMSFNVLLVYVCKETQFWPVRSRNFSFEIFWKRIVHFMFKPQFDMSSALSMSGLCFTIALHGSVAYVKDRTCIIVSTTLR